MAVQINNPFLCIKGRPVRPVLYALGLCLMVAACGGGAQTTRDMYSGASGQKDVSPTERTADPSAKTAERGEKQAQQISPTRMAALKEFGLEGAPSPQKLVGMKPSVLKRVLGDPIFIRRDQGVEIWQYQSETCILDLFLYEKESGFVVDHTELRGPQLKTPYDPACFSKMLRGLS